MATCVVPGCTYSAASLSPIPVCEPHLAPLYEAWARTAPFRCSAQTQRGTACQREGEYRAHAAVGFVLLCPRHMTDWDNRVRYAEHRDAEERQRQQDEVAAAKRKTSLVYFVERETFIKIGVTTNLRSRLQSLSRGGNMPDGMTVGPVRLLATLPGDAANEAHFHRRFREFRIPTTEWFYPAPELLAFIRGLSGFVTDEAAALDALCPRRQRPPATSVLCVDCANKTPGHAICF